MRNSNGTCGLSRDQDGSIGGSGLLPTSSLLSEESKINWHFVDLSRAANRAVTAAAAAEKALEDSSQSSPNLRESQEADAVAPTKSTCCPTCGRDRTEQKSIVHISYVVDSGGSGDQQPQVVERAEVAVDADGGGSVTRSTSTRTVPGAGGGSRRLRRQRSQGGAVPSAPVRQPTQQQDAPRSRSRSRPQLVTEDCSTGEMEATEVNQNGSAFVVTSLLFKPQVRMSDGRADGLSIFLFNSKSKIEFSSSVPPFPPLKYVHAGVDMAQVLSQPQL